VQTPGAAATSSRKETEYAVCDGTYTDAFLAVLHSLLTLFTAPVSNHGTPAEGWVIPAMLRVLSCAAPAHYDSLTTMLKMLDIYLEVSQSACTRFLEQGGCSRMLDLCARVAEEAGDIIAATGAARGAPPTPAASLSWPPTDLGTVPARHRNLIKARCHPPACLVTLCTTQRTHTTPGLTASVHPVLWLLRAGGRTVGTCSWRCWSLR
jgi:hypothetical protein